MNEDRLFEILSELKVHITTIFMLIFLTPALYAKPSATHLSLQVSRMPFQRDYFFPERTAWGHELQLRWDVGWSRWFMDNNITGRTFNSRFRYVSWEYETGVKVTPGFDVIWHHHSQHAMDEYRNNFPVLDSWGVRLTFIGGH